jgi:hypothetical protein
MNGNRKMSRQIPKIEPIKAVNRISMLETVKKPVMTSRATQKKVKGSNKD